jgi:hypothetical protein
MTFMGRHGDEATASDAPVRRGDLETADLAELLGQFSTRDLHRVAQPLVAYASGLSKGSRHLPRTLQVNANDRKHLIAAIVDDFTYLARYSTDRAPTYRQVLQAIALRHRVHDDGKLPASTIERLVQRVYLGALRPPAKGFVDAGRDAALRKLLYLVPGGGWTAFLLSPNWKAVTAAVLEIAALRRIALMRELNASLEA